MYLPQGKKAILCNGNSRLIIGYNGLQLAEGGALGAPTCQATTNVY
jgi:hypothetical protein